MHRAHRIEEKGRGTARVIAGVEHRAFRLTIGHLPRVLEQPDHLEARAQMQLGAAYAGIAIEMSMLGAAHAVLFGGGYGAQVARVLATLQ